MKRNDAESRYWRALARERAAQAKANRAKAARQRAEREVLARKAPR